MSSKFQIVFNDAIDPVRWDELMNNSDYSSAFQTLLFHKTFNSIPRLKCHAYAVANGTGVYLAACLVCLYAEKGIKSYFSRRAIIYGGPLLSESIKHFELVHLLRSISKDLKRKVIFIEIRNFHDYSKYNEVYRELKWIYKPYLNIKQPLAFSSEQELISSFKYNRRREIKINVKAGLKYREATSEEDVKTLYHILHDLYTKKVGLPVPDLAFFIRFWLAEIIKVFIVLDGENIIGGSFCPVLPGKSIYTFYYCGKRNYKPKLFPTHMAVLAAMEYGLRNGYKYMDFMGAGLPDVDYGVRKYKLAFGGELVEEGRQIKINNKLLYFIGSKGIAFLKKK